MNGAGRKNLQNITYAQDKPPNIINRWRTENNNNFKKIEFSVQPRPSPTGQKCLPIIWCDCPCKNPIELGPICLLLKKYKYKDKEGLFSANQQ
jgi:hypothetical protein